MGERVILGANRCSFTSPLGGPPEGRSGAMKEIRTDSTEWRERGVEPAGPVERRTSCPLASWLLLLNIVTHAGCHQQVVPSTPTVHL